MKRQQGFTLIEASVAIAVVAILSGAIVPLVMKNISDAKIARAKNDVQVIAGAIAAQIKDTGTRPHLGSGAAAAVWISGTGTSPFATTDGTALAVTNGTGLGATHTTFLNLFSNTTANAAAIFGAAATYNGPYMNVATCETVDPWGNAYMIFGYNATGLANSSPITVVSSGPDGHVGSANVTASTAAPMNGNNPTANVMWTTNSTAATLTYSQDDIVAHIN